MVQAPLPPAYAISPPALMQIVYRLLLLKHVRLLVGYQWHVLYVRRTQTEHEESSWDHLREL